MERRRIAWLIALGLTGAGGLLGHMLVHELVGSPYGSHSGHGAPGHWSACLAICGSTALLAAGAFRASRAPLWCFALVPPLGFALQAQFEWALQVGHAGQFAALGESTLFGVFIQIPFAVAAYVIARGLLVLAVALVGRAARSPRSRSVGGTARLAHRFSSAPHRLLFASGHGQRAPPARLA